MDLAYWGFRRWPFERSFAADRFFAGSMHDEALARLLFLVEEYRSTGIVIGPAGTGKTYLLNLLRHRANRLGRMTVYGQALGLDGHELAHQIAAGCHVDCDPDATPARIWSGLHECFTALALVQQPLVIAIDHFDPAETSCRQVVCRLRQLADAVAVKLTIVLATRERIVPADLQDHLELRIDISPWTLAECASFINMAVSDAGSSKTIFTDDALNSIHESTRGVPATVVAVCNLALLAAMGRDETRITNEIVDAAVCELMPRTTGFPPKARQATEPSAAPSMARS